MRFSHAIHSVHAPGDTNGSGNENGVPARWQGNRALDTSSIASRSSTATDNDPLSSARINSSRVTGFVPSPSRLAFHVRTYPADSLFISFSFLGLFHAASYFLCGGVAFTTGILCVPSRVATFLPDASLAPTDDARPGAERPDINARGVTIYTREVCIFARTRARGGLAQGVNGSKHAFPSMWRTCN